MGLTRAAAALHRQLLLRAGPGSNRILLSSWSSTDWHSLTFSGERHEASFVIAGYDPAELGRRWSDGLAEAEFDLPGGFVAEIKLAGEPITREDGALLINIEALTLVD
jgi:hypothetical protein